MRASDLIELLRRRYDRPAYAFFDEVRNKTGFSIGGPERYADGLAVSLYPSKGIELLGFEVKVSRQDFKREIEDPSKAESFARFCSGWYLVTPKGLVSKAEVPEGWGLLESADGAPLRERIKAPKRRQVEPITLGLFASLVRALDKERERRPDVWKGGLDSDGGPTKAQLRELVGHPLEVAEKHHGLEALDDLADLDEEP